MAYLLHPLALHYMDFRFPSSALAFIVLSLQSSVSYLYPYQQEV